MTSRQNTKNLKPFKPGQSGNPKGSSKKQRASGEYKRIIAKFQNDHGEEGLLVLMEIMQDDSASFSARVSAAKAVHEFFNGKADANVNLKGESTHKVEFNLTEEQMERAAKEFLVTRGYDFG